MCLVAALLAPPTAAADDTAKSRPALRVVTFNVFQDLDAAQHRRDWLALRHRADVVLLQETEGFRVADLVASRRWKVFQAGGDAGESAVVVRRSAVRSAGSLLVRRVLSAQDCAGAGIGPRYLVSARLVLRNGATLRVAEGSITAIVGPNGAGKTSLLKAVSGLQPIRAGTIRFRGARIDAQAEREVAALGIAHIPEGRRVFAKMTVFENLRLGAYLRSDAREVTRTLESVFEAFPRLRERQAQRAGSLSGGEQQMLAIGRALMAAPRLILADEMSQGLAPVIVQEVYRRLLEVNRRGVTILLVEQNARLAFTLAHVVYVMEQGRVVLEGPAAEVAASEHVQRAYLGVG